MGNRSVVAVDSQCLSYVIDALGGIGEPTDVLHDERKALFQIYLYAPWTFCVTPTVESEYARIRNPQRRELHESFVAVLFETFAATSAEEEESINRRALELGSFHAGVNDCKVVAECEALNQE